MDCFSKMGCTRNPSGAAGHFIRRWFDGFGDVGKSWSVCAGPSTEDRLRSLVQGILREHDVEAGGLSTFSASAAHRLNVRQDVQ